MKTEIRNHPGSSSYFGGGYRGYGRYQWGIKYYGFESEFEIELAQNWAFGSYTKLQSGKYGFWLINDLLGREVEASIEGRSGGWFVIHSKLSKAELDKVDAHIEQCREYLPDFLIEEREFRKSEAVL